MHRPLHEVAPAFPSCGWYHRSHKSLKRAKTWCTVLTTVLTDASEVQGEYPQCTHYPPYSHPHKNYAVQMRQKSCVELFCKRTTACRKAHAAALKAATNKP